MMLILKRCNVCREGKRSDDFYRNHTAPDGRAWTCIACEKKRVRNHQAYDARRDKEAKRAADRGSWARNALAIKVRRAAAYSANPGPQKERAAAWRAANPERKRALGRRDHIRRMTGRDLSAEAAAYTVALQHDPCAYCGGHGGELDHIVAVSVGGTSSVDNLTAACRRCNASKSAGPFLYFLLARPPWPS